MLLYNQFVNLSIIKLLDKRVKSNVAYLYLFLEKRLEEVGHGAHDTQVQEHTDVISVMEPPITPPPKGGADASGSPMESMDPLAVMMSPSNLTAPAAA